MHVPSLNVSFIVAQPVPVPKGNIWAPNSSNSKLYKEIKIEQSKLMKLGRKIIKFETIIKFEG
jgi:hypothetical protein